MTSPQPLRILVIGAHPDDCDIKAGGIAAKYAAAGHTVCFVSMTNGDAGHQEIGGVQLARRRRAEAEAAGRVIGIDYRVLDHHDAELEPTLANRKTTIRLIRNFRPDLILTHRPNDYHPDHRYTSILVQDASFLITVPNVCTDTQALERMPTIAYLSDAFTRPYPFTPDLIVGIDEVIEQKLEMIHCHASQMYEWLPWLAGQSDQVPAGDNKRRRWLAEKWDHRIGRYVAERHRDLLTRWYGPDHGQAVRYAEAFEICEYGVRPDEGELRRLFPFFDA